MKRMKHPDHGFHHAYGKHEEEAMRKAGWVDDIPESVPSENFAEPSAYEKDQIERMNRLGELARADVAEALEVTPKRRPGPKPKAKPEA